MSQEMAFRHKMTSLHFGPNASKGAHTYMPAAKDTALHDCTAKGSAW